MDLSWLRLGDDIFLGAVLLLNAMGAPVFSYISRPTLQSAISASGKRQ
jgi:hypothetical protein